MLSHSGKSPENTLSTTSAKSMMTSQVSYFVIRLRDSSRQFVLKILTKNFVFNLSGTLFFIGIGCSLKWWYKDQLFISFLKKNLPVLSEPQQRISWETGEYVIKKYSCQFVKNKKALPNNISQFDYEFPFFPEGDTEERAKQAQMFHEVKNSFPTCCSNPLKRTFNDANKPIGVINKTCNEAAPVETYKAEKHNLLSTKETCKDLVNLNKSNDTKIFHIPLKQKLTTSNSSFAGTAAASITSAGCTASQAARSSTRFLIPYYSANVLLSRFEHLIERIDLYANNVTIKFKSPWQKRAYQKFVGIFSESFQEKHKSSIPLGERICNPFNSTDQPFLAVHPLHPTDVQDAMLLSKPQTGSCFANNKFCSTFYQPYKVGKAGKPTILNKQCNVAVNAKEDGKVNNFKMNFAKYELWKPLYPNNWFKLSARGLCILNGENFFQPTTMLGACDKKNWTRFWKPTKCSFKFSLPTKLRDNQNTHSLENFTKATKFSHFYAGSWAAALQHWKNLILRPLQRSSLTGSPLNIKLTDLRIILETKNFATGENGICELNSKKCVIFKETYNTKSTTIKKLSYPLELTTTMSGWQPPIDVLIFNSYLDEIPYKLESTLLVLPYKKDLDLLSVSYLKYFHLPPASQDHVLSDLLSSKSTDQLRQINKLTTIVQSDNFEKKCQLVEMKQLLKCELQFLVNKLPIICVNNFLGLKSSLKKNNYYDVYHEVEKEFKKLPSEKENWPASQDQQVVNLEFLPIDTKSMFDKIQESKIPSTGVNLAQTPISLNFWPSTLHSLPNFTQNQLKKKSLQSFIENLKTKNFKALLTFPTWKSCCSISYQPFEDGKSATQNSRDNVENFTEILKKHGNSMDCLLLLNNLGFTFNNISSLNTPPALLPIYKKQSFSMCQLLASTKSNYTPTKKEKTQNSVPANKNLEKNASLLANFPKEITNDEFAVQHGHQSFEAGSSVGQIDTTFQFDPNVLTWEILQKMRCDQQGFSFFIKSVKNKFQKNINFNQIFTSNCINRAIITQKNTTLAKINDINPVDKVINFTHRKSRIMSGYIYPDMKSSSLKANLYQWLTRISAQTISNGFVSSEPLIMNNKFSFPFFEKKKVDYEFPSVENVFFTPTAYCTSSTSCTSEAGNAGVGFSRETIGKAWPLPRSISQSTQGLAQTQCLYPYLRLDGSCETLKGACQHYIPRGYSKMEPCSAVHRLSLSTKLKKILFFSNLNGVFYPKSFRGVQRFVEKACLGNVEIPIPSTTFLSSFFSLDGTNYKSAVFHTLPALHPLHALHPTDVQHVQQDKQDVQMVQQAHKNYVGSMDSIYNKFMDLYLLEDKGKVDHIRPQLHKSLRGNNSFISPSSTNISNRIVCSNVKKAAFPLLQKKINNINVSVIYPVFDFPLGKFISLGPATKLKTGIVNSTNEKKSVIESSKSSTSLLVPQENKLKIHRGGNTTEFADDDNGISCMYFDPTVDQRGALSTGVFLKLTRNIGQLTDVTKTLPIDTSANNSRNGKLNCSNDKTAQKRTHINEVLNQQKLNYHFSFFPGFSKTNDFFLSLLQIAQGNDAILYNTTPISSSFENVSSQFFLPKSISSTNKIQEHKAIEKNKNQYFIDCNKRKTAYYGVVVRRNTLTKDFQPTNFFDNLPYTSYGDKAVNTEFLCHRSDSKGHKELGSWLASLPVSVAHSQNCTSVNRVEKVVDANCKTPFLQSSIWGTIFLGSENPLTDRQCHFFGQRRFSTMNTNNSQRDYLRQLGKETLAQSNGKGFTEKSTFIERSKILSFSKTVNSFFLKKRKYTYLVEEKDQWHLLFQEQLRSALNDFRKYPPLKPDEIKDHGLGRIKISAPLIMARFPKKIDKLSQLRNSSDMPLIYPDFANSDSFSTMDQLRKTSMNQLLHGLSPQIEKLSQTNMDNQTKCNVCLTTDFKNYTNNVLSELSQIQHNIFWRPLSCLKSAHLLTPLMPMPHNSMFLANSLDYAHNNSIEQLFQVSKALHPLHPLHPTDVHQGKQVVQHYEVNTQDLTFVPPENLQNRSRHYKSYATDTLSLPKIINHYPLFAEKHNSELTNVPWLNTNSLSSFNNLRWLTHEPLTVASWAVISQWSFLVALLFWIEQMLSDNVFPALFTLEQLLLGATGIKSGDRTQIIRVSKGNKPKFQDIAGVDGLLGELAEFVLFLRAHKERFWNKKSSYGVLLTGPPGTGKTFLVRALANEAKVPVLILSAGTLTSNKLNNAKPSWSIRHAFRRAKQLAPCILFIDEIDALGKSRGKIVTDINEIVADSVVVDLSLPSSDTSPTQKIAENPALTASLVQQAPFFEMSKQLQQNWPFVAKPLINEWQNPLFDLMVKSKESSQFDGYSLGENEISDFWNHEITSINFERGGEGQGAWDKFGPSHSTMPHTDTTSNNGIIPNSTVPQGTLQERAFSQNSQRENIKRKFGPLTQLLVSMDGISNLSGVLIIGATNRPESLDPALTRPGRFERIIRVEKPSEQKRIEILQLYSHNLGIQDQIPWSYLANRTLGLTAADLAVAMNYSSLKAIMEGTMHTIETIEYGLDSIVRFSTKSAMRRKDVLITNKSEFSFSESAPDKNKRLKSKPRSGVEKFNIPDTANRDTLLNQMKAKLT